MRIFDGGETLSCDNLRLEMLKNRITIEDLANFLGIHRNSVSNKLNGNSSFSIEESMAIQERYFPDKDLKYLFKKGEKKTGSM